MDGEKDLPRWVTTCGIDLFERHITLRFPLVRLMNRLLIWCPLVKNWDLRQAPLWFDGCSAFWTHRDTLHLQCRPLAVHRLQASGAVNLVPRWGSWLLITTWWQYWAAIRRACDRGTASYQEGGNAASDVAQNKVSVGGGLMVNHSAASQCR